jgi:hypothetical protein
MLSMKTRPHAHLATNDLTSASYTTLHGRILIMFCIRKVHNTNVYRLNPYKCASA